MYNKEVYVDYEKVKVLKLRREMELKNFTFHPLVFLEESFVPAGETDMEKRKSTLAFTKKLNSLSSDLDTLFEKKFQVYTALTEFKCVYKLMETEEAFNYLAKLYAGLDYSLQELNKFLKSQKNAPELLNDVKEFDELLSLNVWETMAEDFKYMEPVCEQRLNVSKERFPKYEFWSKHSVDWDKVKENYKESLKQKKQKK